MYIRTDIELRVHQGPIMEQNSVEEVIENGLENPQPSTSGEQSASTGFSPGDSLPTEVLEMASDNLPDEVLEVVVKSRPSDTPFNAENPEATNINDMKSQQVLNTNNAGSPNSDENHPPLPDLDFQSIIRGVISNFRRREFPSYIRHSSSNFTPRNTKVGIMEFFIILFSFIIVVVTFPILMFFCFKVVKENERIVLFRLGRLKKEKSEKSGVIFVLPWLDKYTIVDLRTRCCKLPAQELPSADIVTTTFTPVVYYSVTDPILAVNSVEDYNHYTQALAAGVLRICVVNKNFGENLRSQFGEVNKLLNEITECWGVKVHGLQITSVNLHPSLVRTMAAPTEAAHEVVAKWMAAEGEKEELKRLAGAAEIIQRSPEILQLRYLQTARGTAENNSTVMFPLPMDIMKGFLPNFFQSSPGSQSRPGSQLSSGSQSISGQQPQSSSQSPSDQQLPSGSQSTSGQQLPSGSQSTSGQQLPSGSQSTSGQQLPSGSELQNFSRLQTFSQLQTLTERPAWSLPTSKSHPPPGSKSTSLSKPPFGSQSALKSPLSSVTIDV